MKDARLDYRALPWIRIHRGGMLGRMKRYLLGAGKTARIS